MFVRCNCWAIKASHASGVVFSQMPEYSTAVPSLLPANGMATDCAWPPLIVAIFVFFLGGSALLWDATLTFMLTFVWPLSELSNYLNFFVFTSTRWEMHAYVSVTPNSVTALLRMYALYSRLMPDWPCGSVEPPIWPCVETWKPSPSIS